ncbi:MAG: hypothetical protein EOO12_00635 [Chitinophagaceae bacterium]|nr:MAG: hypothetical protein EOO12_00635 [Chitinophagaceae bacterium]
MVTWEKEKGNFEANWGGKPGEDHSVTFTPNGSLVEIVKAIKVSELPAPVASYVKAHYKNARITEAGKVTDAKGTETYEAEVKGKELRRLPKVLQVEGDAKRVPASQLPQSACIRFQRLRLAFKAFGRQALVA